MRTKLIYKRFYTFKTFILKEKISHNLNQLKIKHQYIKQLLLITIKPKVFEPNYLIPWLIKFGYFNQISIGWFQTKLICLCFYFLCIWILENISQIVECLIWFKRQLRFVCLAWENVKEVFILFTFSVLIHIQINFIYIRNR